MTGSYRKPGVLERLLTVVALVGLMLSLASTVHDRFTFFAVTRGVSMEPVLGNNSLVLFAPYQLVGHLRRAREGDIIVFRAPAIPRLWAHRIVEEVRPGKYRTQGDNNPRPDSFLVDERDILGVVPVWKGQPLALPWCGWLFLQWQARSWLRWGSLGGVLALLVLLPPERRRRLRRRVLARKAPLTRLAFAGGCAAVLFAVTLYPFLFRSGYSAVGYRVAEGDGISYGGSVPVDLGVVREGGTREEERPVANAGIFPVLVLFRAEDETGQLRVEPQRLVLPPRSAGTVTFRVEAGRAGEWRRVTLAMATVPAVLPADWVDGLSRIHPLVPNLVLSGGMGLTAGTLGFLLVGSRPGRLPRRHQRWAGLRVLGAGLAVVALLVAGLVLPGFLASTALLVGLPGEVAVRSAPPGGGTFAWSSGEGTVEAGGAALADLLWVENDYARSVRVDVSLVQDAGGIVVDWTQAQRVDPSVAVPCPVLLEAPPGLEPGEYPLVFRVAVSAEGGGLLTWWDTRALVHVLPAPEPEPGEGEEGP